MSFVEIIVAFVVISALVLIVTFIVNRKLIPNINSDNDVIELLRSGDKLKAIKAYRQLHGVGLNEAKAFIDKCE